MPVHYQFADLFSKTVFRPWSLMLDGMLDVVTHDLYPLKNTPLGRLQAASLESVSRLLSHYPKPDFGITSTEIDGVMHPVHERVAVDRPFCRLLHFDTGISRPRPKLLFVAALAGHHASLARETYEAFLPDHDVYVTDWRDARYVPLAQGSFGFEDYVRYVIEFLEHLGPRTHVVAICQATVPTLTAVAAMAAGRHGDRPGSMTLMAGPIDIRAQPNLLSHVASLSSPGLQRSLAVTRVPMGYPGTGRRVYPGLVQLFAFLGINLYTHLQKHRQFFSDIYHQEHDAAQKHREFYDEFFSVLDVTEEFFVETLERVFYDQQLAKGTMQYDGDTVDCRAITDVPLMTVEGAEDEMCLPGMTAAAQDLCSALPDELRRHHLQQGVGHYGVFSGSRFRKQVAPAIKDFIRSHLA